MYLMASIPPFTKHDIRSLVGERSYERGAQYAESGAIFNGRREEKMLKASCEGSQMNAYRVRVEFNKRGIADSRCSCPIGGSCKHVAALLLTWLRSSESFAEVASLKASLEGMPKENLVALILKMTDRHADLERLLESMVMGKQRTADPEQYRRQAEAALRFAATEDGDLYQASEELSDLMEISNELQKEKNFDGASAVCEGILQAYLRCYDDIAYEEGEISGEMVACAERCGALLRSGGNFSRRPSLMQVLWETVRFDNRYSGEVASEIEEQLRKHASAEERKMYA